MTVFERIEDLRKSRKISQGKLEKELGFSNGSISKWKTSMPTPERLQKIADYFGVTIDFLMTGKEETIANSELTVKDEREIGRDLDRIMEEIENDVDGPLFYNGEPIDEESLRYLRNALEFGLRELKKENKVKYGRKKKKD
ncbi:XRE family transcriptional regulator [Hungatella hathewayi]|uniref:helix-turn-helix domain-containing protein n=1 Tax=Hungatella hathewayi TaxID=154046 RepID=UPI000E44DE4D|nr:helix-turn-helix transcriptional regulator [Hungatella hathewayi]RGO69233.1 XRE family transcriptional regulator [Hungatella hathewayi]